MTEKPEIDMSRHYFDENMEHTTDSDTASWVSISVYADGERIDQTLWQIKDAEKSSDYFGKSKVYVKDPSKVPKGRTAKRGPKGGYYYETDSSGDMSDEELIEWFQGEGLELKDHGTLSGEYYIPQPYDDYIRRGVVNDSDKARLVRHLDGFTGHLSEEEIEGMKIGAPNAQEDFSWDGGKRSLDTFINYLHRSFSYPESKAQHYAYENLGRALEKKGLTSTWALNWWSFLFKKWYSSANGSEGKFVKEMAERFITSKGEIKPYEPRAEDEVYWNESTMSEELRDYSNVYTRQDYDGFVANYEYTQWVLKNGPRSFFSDVSGREEDFEPRKDGKMVLYRGIGPESHKKWIEAGKPDNFPFKDAKLSSWSVSRARASNFAAAGLGGAPETGIVLRTEVPFEKIYTTYASNPAIVGEGECVIVGGKEDSAEVVMEYDDGYAIWEKKDGKETNYEKPSHWGKN